MSQPRPAVPQNGFAIRAFRERESLTVAALAEQTGLSDSHVRNIETENRPASPEHLARIADVLNVTPAALSRLRASELVDNRKATRRAALQGVG
jgi:transcriptional regulator with XRE-family HTH domain